MAQPSSRLGLRFRQSQLLHLLPPQTIWEQIQQHPDLLFELSWKLMAIQQPAIAAQLIKQALETAESHDDLNRRWSLVSCDAGLLLVVSKAQREAFCCGALDVLSLKSTIQQTS